MIRLPICQINYAEVNSNYITIHSQQTITLKMTLSELEKKLDSHFFRAGRSALVNLKKISRVTKKEKMCIRDSLCAVRVPGLS